MFVPGFQHIRPWWNLFDAKTAVRSAHGMEGMVVDPDERLHPAVDVAFHDDRLRAGHSNYLGAVRWQAEVLLS